MIRYDEPIDDGCFRDHAARHVRETLTLLDGDGWGPASTRGGVEVRRRRLDVARARQDAPDLIRRVDALRATIRVRAPRAAVFALLAHPTRAPEWDTSDRGFQWVACFDDDHTVFRNLNQPPLFRVRDSVIYRVERRDLEPGRSLYCARSVVHAACPYTAHTRILQPPFAWDVRDVGAGQCEVRVLCATPENMLPGPLFPLLAAPGWRSILQRVRRLVEAPEAGARRGHGAR